MASRVYPTNAARGGTTTLTGGGSANDIFTFPNPVKVMVQNNSSGPIYIATGVGTGVAATQGDELVNATQAWLSDEQASWIALYGTAATVVNGTTTGGLVIYGIA